MSANNNTNNTNNAFSFWDEDEYQRILKTGTLYECCEGGFVLIDNQTCYDIDEDDTDALADYWYVSSEVVPNNKSFDLSAD